MRGDSRALAMATPAAAARGLARLMPTGPVLELCCGAGGATAALAARGPVLAVDRDAERLARARQNLADLGLAGRVAWLACDLARPALSRPSALFAACLLDPDWAPAGRPSREWTQHLGLMQPPADALWRFAGQFSPCLALRLPPGLRGLPPGKRLVVRKQGRVLFEYLLAGPWKSPPNALDI